MNRHHVPVALFLAAVFVASLLSACAPDSPLSGELEAQRRLPLHNPTMRGEIARALTHLHPDVRDPEVRFFPADAVARILGSAGPTIEPDEVRDIEHLFQRMYLEDYPAGQWVGDSYPHILGSLVTVGILGETDVAAPRAFASQRSRLPSEGEPVSLDVLTSALRDGGCDTLRADIVLWAIHQRDVAATNNRVIRRVPFDQTFEHVKGMSFRPRYHSAHGDVDVSWKDDSWMLKNALDYPYRANLAPVGERFEIGEIGEPNEVTAAELGAHLSFPGIRSLRSFDEVRVSTDVPSPPATVWANILNPGRRMGQRLRNLSALLDRIESDGELRAELLWMVEGRSHPEAETRRYLLSLGRERFLASLGHLMFRAMNIDDIGDFAGRLFVEGNEPCDDEPSCPVSVDYFSDARWQRPRLWFRPELRVLRGTSDEQVFVPFGRFLQKEEWATRFDRSDLATWYAAQHFDIAPVETDPLALELPRLPVLRPNDAQHITTVEGRSYDMFEWALFRDGELVTPYPFGLGHTVWMAQRKPIMIDDRIYFLPRHAEAWQRDRGTLVYDMRADVWLHGPFVDLSPWLSGSLRFEGTVLHGLSDPGHVAHEIDLSTWTLEPAIPGEVTPPEPAFPPCVHSACVEGPALVASCGACAADLCSLDAYCCDVAWDALCVEEATRVCSGLACE